VTAVADLAGEAYRLALAPYREACALKNPARTTDAATAAGAARDVISERVGIDRTIGIVQP
jgi:hypothetical protein